MPLTVKAVHSVLPDQPGLAFGLPSAALLLGAGPCLANVRLLSSPVVVVTVALASAGSLVLGLRLLRRNGLPVGPPGDSLLAGSRDG